MPLSELDKHFAKMAKKAEKSSKERGRAAKAKSNNNNGATTNGNNANTNGAGARRVHRGASPTRRLPKRMASAPKPTTGMTKLPTPLSIDEDHSNHYSISSLKMEDFEDNSKGSAKGDDPFNTRGTANSNGNSGGFPNRTKSDPMSTLKRNSDPFRQPRSTTKKKVKEGENEKGAATDGDDEEEDIDDSISINTTNTANIRISRRARAQADGKGGEVKTKSLVKNFRLSRNLSRVVSDQQYSKNHHAAAARSASPSHKLLAAEIAVEHARREMTSAGSTGSFMSLMTTEPPPLEQTPLLMMRFTNKANAKLISLVENRLLRNGLIIYDKVEDTDEPHYTYLYLSAAQEALEAFAEQIRWMKRTNDTKVVEYFTVQQRRKFITKKNNKISSKKKRSLALAKNKTNDDDDDIFDPDKKRGMGGDDLFTSNEWCHLAMRLLDSVEVMVENESMKDLNLLLMLQENDENTALPPPPPPPPPTRTSSSEGRTPPPSSRSKHLRKQTSFSSGGTGGSLHSTSGMPNRRNFRRQTSMGSLGSASSDHGIYGRGGGPPMNRRHNLARQQSMKMQRVSTQGKRSSCLRHVLQANEFVDVVTPIHWGPARAAIVKQTLTPNQLMPPVQDIRNYYGEDVAFYFAWMGTLSNWLVALGGMGAFTQALQWYRNDQLDEDEYTPMYGLFTFLWGVFFLRFWQRHEHRLAYRWGTYSLSSYDKLRYLTTRPQFKGVLRISPVTGDYETYYPARKRRLQYAVSALVTMLMLGVAFWMMIMSLNMQGFVHPEKNPERWNENNPHPFHYPGFAILSEKGYMFDATHRWKSFLPSILHVAMIFSLNNLYRVIAEMLTEWENHETEATYRTSLIVKRFLFEAFDCYVALFYLAFYERDVDRLHEELVTVFNIDTFRRLSMECFIPLTVRKVSKWLHPHDHHHLVSEADQEMAEDAAQEEEYQAAHRQPMDKAPTKRDPMDESSTTVFRRRRTSSLRKSMSNDSEMMDASLGKSALDAFKEFSAACDRRTELDDDNSDSKKESHSKDKKAIAKTARSPRSVTTASRRLLADESDDSEAVGSGIDDSRFSNIDDSRFDIDNSCAFGIDDSRPFDIDDSRMMTDNIGISGISSVDEPPTLKKMDASRNSVKLPQRKPPKKESDTAPAKPKKSEATATPSKDAANKDIQVAYIPPTVEELAEEAELEEYEAFDDYMEIVIQFGYVTLFASAYPLASLVALAANWVEIRSDCFKLSKVCQRPRSYRSDGIGVWNVLLSCVVWTSALTNCLIVGFTSDQMSEIFPHLYTTDMHGDSDVDHESGWIAIFVIFGLERVLLILGLLIYAIVPEVPEDVQNEMERLHYIREREHESILRQVMRRRAQKKKR